MRILLDESVPQKLRLLIEGDHIVITARFQGWSGLTNGALLDAAEQAGFDLFITADQEIRYQQNLLGRKLAILGLFRRLKLRMAPPTITYPDLGHLLFMYIPNAS